MNPESILIMTVGGSRDQLCFTIQRHDPGGIVFIPSRDTERTIPDLVEAAYGQGLQPKWSCFTVDDPDDLPSCYRACARAFDQLMHESREMQIVADATGGTKMMGAALVLASAQYGVTHSYIAGERTKDGVGVVRSGTERVVHTSHPYDLYSVSQKQQLAQFFNSTRFEAAQTLCTTIAARSGETIRPYFSAMKKLINGYVLWDRFKHGEALHHLGTGSEQLLKLMSQYDDERLTRFVTVARTNVAWLQNLLASQTGSLPSWNLVLDLNANACRRAEEGKYDDAVARLYRATEMIAQWRFAVQFGCGTSRFPVDKLTELARRELRTRPNADGLANIGSQEAFRILAAMDDEYGRLFVSNQKGIESALAVRNGSILAHGTVPLDQNKYERVREVLVGSFDIQLPAEVAFPEMDADALLALSWSE